MNAKNLFASTAILALLTSSVAFASDNQNKAQRFKAELTALNSSGVVAEVKLKLRDDKLNVKIEASGLEPGRIHPQHIHGHDDASINADCPTLIADVDGDNLVSVTEGLPNYGPIVLPLTPFDLVDDEGNLYYRTSISIDPSQLQALHNRAIVMHGMSVNGTYIPSLPIACGQLKSND
ncbi:MAG: hypothetical protein OEY38_14590 [Gammaproteobacteria bacterium]|nr:hypothetical protein [Gammaproteobacteria bacterium]